ncbi:ribosome hibernation promoting factor [Vibrio sp. SS-MA-C1-2]|uniref:ribosome hibernation promoting factor n=1 Tax=Vibrio sp. SS-MA-C1-2 TaxID=2908646 RepID=UPI001EFFEB53|nr:ribosome hibernation promoting factor [Vibrio sp. SS-MA-C1-2]UJF19582.1 ribosome hibernation promoting factor [Vibrio sp. SS-MA-C1-2]
MNINLTGHHVEITSSIRQFVEEKFVKLERFFDPINNVHVVLKVEKNTQQAEAILHVSSGEIYASSQSEDMYTAIDTLIDKLVRQLNKHKEKLNSH